MMKIIGEIGTIIIDILTNKTSGTQDFWEENWLYANVRGEFPGFKANYDCNLRTDDFERCVKELTFMLSEENYNQVAQFTTLEEGLQIIFKKDDRGSVKISGKMTPPDLPYWALEFNLTTDIPTIQRLIDEMQQVLDMYPIIGIQ